MDNPKSGCAKMTFRAPEIIIPNPPTKTYTLRVDVYYGQELPGTEGLLSFSIGPYLDKTITVKSNSGVFHWH